MDYQKLFSLIPKEPRRWNSQDVEQWLEHIGLGDLSSNFQRNAIDGACLEVLNEDDLNELGIVSSVKRKKLLQWISSGLQEYKQFVRGAMGQNEWCIASKQVIGKENQMEYTPIQKLSEIQPLKDNRLKDSFSGELIESMKVVEAPLKQETYGLETTKLPIYGSGNRVQIQASMQIMELESNKKIQINQNGLTIGRNFDSGLVCSEDYVSRNHCKITYDNSTKYFYLTDVGSSSGTFILLTQPSLMKQGFIIHMGSMQYKIEQLNIKGNDCDVVLKVIEGEQRGLRFPFQLKKNQTVLKFGRVLAQFSSDSHLSSNHALFSYTDDGLILEDTESRNGVWVRMSEQGMTSDRVKLVQDRQFRLGYEKIFLCQ